VTNTRLLLAAGTAAAALGSLGPLVHGGAVAVGPLRVGGHSGTTAVVVPPTAHLLTAQASGSRAVAAQTRVTVLRTADGATLFTGSLATFKALQVAPGTSLQVRVQRPARYAGLKAASVLQWS
jgi:hypothetical protein